MAFLNDTTVMSGECIVVWDSLSKPEPQKGEGGKPDTLKYGLSLCFHPNAPEYGELHKISQDKIAVEYPRGIPGNFQQAFRAVPAEANQEGHIPELVGWIKFSASTYGNMPEVIDAQAQPVAPQDLGRFLYAGAKVRVIVTARTYDARGNKGASFWLSGVQILDATAPRLSIAAGMSSAQVRSAFGVVAGAPALPLTAAPMAPQPAIPAPAAPAPGMPAAPLAPPAPVGVAAPPAPGLTPAPVPGAVAPSAPTAPTYPTNVAPPAPVAVTPNPGILTAGVAPATPVAPPAPPAPVAAPAAPAAFATNPAKTQFTYAQLIQAGWTHDQIAQSGFLA